MSYFALNLQTEKMRRPIFLNHLCATALFLICTSILSFAQQETAYFSNDGSKILIFQESFDRATQLWTGDYHVYSRQGEGATVTYSKKINDRFQPTLTEELERLKTEYKTSEKGVESNTQGVSGLDFEYKILKKQKVGIPEALYTRKYIVEYSINHSGTTITSDKTTCYTIGKEDKRDEIKTDDVFDISIWKHPSKDLNFCHFTVISQELVMAHMRYTTIDRKQKESLIRIL